MFLGLNDSLCFFWTSSTLKVNDYVNDFMAGVNGCKCNNRCQTRQDKSRLIIKPIDLSNGAHKVMYEPPNRGGKTWASLGRFPAGGNDPGSVTDAAILAKSFLMPRGYTMVWSGWDKAAGTSTAGFNTTITLPIAKNTDFAITPRGAPTPRPTKLAVTPRCPRQRRIF